jgi:23S rRNA (guanine2445-N2)-methyltransferase / 23S rRNA (guanine2069-N7)-methyltransferase
VTTHDLIATAALATEDLVARELGGLGATEVVPGKATIRFRGTLETAYRACLWSRVASRIVLPIARFEAADADGLYAGVRTVDWSQHLGPDDTLAVDLTEHASGIRHTRFGAQRVKDGIVDALREAHGRRPSVDVEQPSLRVNVRVEGTSVTIGVDLAGTSLHRRGYRLEGNEAPLRETLAAAVLLRSRWPDAAGRGEPLIDPMCGSGTLVIEAALMATDAAPGLGRHYFGFLGWRGHDPELWQRVLAEARERRRPTHAAPLVGSDIDGDAVRRAVANARRAGVDGLTTFAARPVAQATPPAPAPGHVITNPPYGERLGGDRDLAPLYAELGQVLKDRFAGWEAHVLTSSEELARALGLAPDRVNALWNGAIACKLLHCGVRDVPRTREPGSVKPRRRAAQPSAPIDEALANRLRKNLKRLAPWAAREGISCYRVYDADIPELAAAVDRYENLVHVQEYAAPAEIDPERARVRLDSLVATVREVLDVSDDRLFVKRRQRQKAGAKYERLAESGELHEVREGGYRFVVNLSDYLDTGLFLDSRLIRQRLGELAAGKRFLNLFAYTATATVHAARGGARSTTSVDLSNTYLGWARRNFELNGVTGRQHELVQADCLGWLAEARGPYDLVLLDPPTFSNSKRMDGTLDVQRDHVEVVNATARLLAPGGVLWFVTNFRRFKLDEAAFLGLEIVDESAATLPFDFARNPRIHRAWSMTRRR